MDMIYRNLIRSLLFSMDAEDAHNFVINFLGKYSFFAHLFQHRFVVKDKRLHVTLQGMDFPNPVGIAAGFDKSADVLHVLPSLGFGFIEVGTVTPLAQPGNPKPRKSSATSEAMLPTIAIVSATIVPSSTSTIEERFEKDGVRVFSQKVY